MKKKNLFIALCVILMLFSLQAAFSKEEAVLVENQVLVENTGEVESTQELSRGETKDIFKDLGVRVSEYGDGLSVDNQGVVSHSSGESIETQSGEFPSGSEMDFSDGITLIVNSDFDRENLPAGNYKVSIRETVAMGELQYIAPLGSEEIVLNYEDGELKLDEFSQINYNGVMVRSYGTTITLGEATEGNYVTFNEDGNLEFSGTKFRVMSDNYVFVPQNEDPSDEPTIVSKFGFDASTDQLQRGDKGDTVRELQAFLAAHTGYDIEIDGIFGEETETRLTDFQRTTKISGVPDRDMEYLPGNGKLDEDTINKINALEVDHVSTENCVIAYYDASFNDGPYTIARVEEGVITTSKKNRMYDIVVESEEQAMHSYYNTEDGTNGIVFNKEGGQTTGQDDQNEPPVVQASGRPASDSEVTVTDQTQTNEIAAMADSYLSRFPINELDSTLVITGEDIAKAALQYDLPPEFILATGQLETRFLTDPNAERGRNTRSVFGVGSWDDGTDHNSYDTAAESVMHFARKIREEYLVDGKTVDDLLSEDGVSYVNYQGNRYSSRTNYESYVEGQMAHIKNNYFASSE